MKKARTPCVKNNLSRLLQQVREGEPVAILDRRQPVAILQPVTVAGGADAERIQDLVRRGVATPPAERLDVKAFRRMPRSSWEGGKTLVEILDEDREDRA
jgi:antitoxin (DNA-binding transcriptional repressor) of toxin-antitoxin stability system